MKKLYSALGILLVITGFCWFTAWRVDDLCNTSASLLEAAETQVMLGDYDAAVETVNHSFRLWNRHEGFFGMALRHTESDDVGILYPVLQEACRQRDQGEFLLRARELAANLRHLGRMEQPYLFNIL